jgi:hypothetical protein
MSEGSDNIEAAVRRTADLTRSYLIEARGIYGPDFGVGIIGVAFELTRPDGWYGVGASCTDDRDWIQSALFRQAMRLADGDEATADEAV